MKRRIEQYILNEPWDEKLLLLDAPLKRWAKWFLFFAAIYFIGVCLGRLMR